MKEVEKWLLDEYGPTLTLADVCQVLKVPEGTVREWKSTGFFDGCFKKCGKRLLFNTLETLRRFQSRRTPKPRPRKTINKEPIP